MERITFILAASATLAASAQTFGAQFAVASLVVDAPHTVTASTSPAHPSEIRLGGVIGPVSGASEMFVTLTLGFEFTESVIAGDMLAARLRLRPNFESGMFTATEMRLTASAYDQGDLVWAVSGEPFQPLQSIGDDVMRSFDIFTGTFEGPGPAFSTIADGGVGQLIATFRWHGFSADDTLELDFAPNGDVSTIQYWNFIPAPGGAGAALLSAALLAVRRRR